MDVERIIQYIQYGGFVSAQLMNVVLLYLLYVRANVNFGRYRVLMVFFSMFAMVYSLIEVLTFPVMFTKGRSLCVCSDGPFTLYRPIGVPLVSIYCGSFGMCISLLALQFYYRYIAVCKPDKLYYFEGKRIIYTFIPCFIVFVVWTSNVHFLMALDEEKENIYYDVLLHSFNVDSHKISFIAMLYKSPATEFEPEHWNLHELVPFFTLLPLFTMYLPVGAVLMFPMLGFELGVNANKTSAFIGLYPALDPLIAILLIEDFRNYVFCRKRTLMKVSTTTGYTDKTSTFRVS